MAWLTKRQIAADLGIHHNSIPRLVRQGRLPQPVRFGPTFVRWDSDEYAAHRRAALEARDRELAAEREVA
jgi:predicted DNA-binding transcriptional regulator AlpA